MKATFTNLSVLLAALLGSLQCHATILSLEPSSQSVALGAPVSVDLIVSGLGDLASPSLGAFDVDLTYNPAVLAATSVAFGGDLDQGTFGSLQFSSLTIAGTIHLDEVSLESAGDLVAGQPSSFRLATLGFNAVGPGASTLDFAFATLSDEAANSLDFITESASVEVTGLPVPEPGSTAGLLGLGFLALLGGFKIGASKSAPD